MVERRVAQPAGLQLSSLAQPHIIEIASPQRGYSAAGEPAEHENARPTVLFDDQSTITADPLFDFSGKPISYLNVAFGGGRRDRRRAIRPARSRTPLASHRSSEDDEIVSQQCRLPRGLCRCVARRRTSVGLARSGRARRNLGIPSLTLVVPARLIAI